MRAGGRRRGFRRTASDPGDLTRGKRRRGGDGGTQGLCFSLGTEGVRRQWTRGRDSILPEGSPHEERSRRE